MTYYPKGEYMVAEELLFDRLRVAAQASFSGHALATMTFEMRNRMFEEGATGLLMSLHAEVIGRTERRDFMFDAEVPATWFQHLKESLDGWVKNRLLRWVLTKLLKRFPVRLHTVAYPHQLDRREMFPDCRQVYPEGFGPVRVQYLAVGDGVRRVGD